MKLLRFSLALFLIGSSLIITTYAQTPPTWTITNNSGTNVLVSDDKGSNKSPVGSAASVPGWELDKNVASTVTVCWVSKDNPNKCNSPTASAIIQTNGTSGTLVISGQCNSVKGACINMPTVTFSN